MPADASRNSLGGMIDGVLSEYALLNETGAIKFPEHLSFEEAATLPCAALTAWNAVVETAQLKAGETVAILGTGGVSCFALAFAKMHGAFVFMTSSSDDKLARAKALRCRCPDQLQRYARLGAGILKQTGGAGVISSSRLVAPARSTLDGRCPPWRHDLRHWRLAGAGTINPRMINRKAIRLQGIHVGSRDMFAAMNKAVALHRLKPAIDKVFSFAEAKAAYAHQQTGKHFGKIVISLP